MIKLSRTQQVSIPFKRESVSKGNQWMKNIRIALGMFQFPSNGKAYPKIDLSIMEVGDVEFQFPSNGKAYPKLKALMTSSCPSLTKEFQFPSNGKAYPKLSCIAITSFAFAFQFPSNGKAYPKECPGHRWPAQSPRVSIPFKRESVSKDPRD